MNLIDNQALLDGLFASERIRLRRGHLFERDVAPKPESFDFDRVEGMLLGLAIGDALGNTSESMTPDERGQRHGEIRDYRLNAHAGDARGYPSDDTQLAFWTLESLIEQGGLDPERLAQRFAREQIYGIGSTLRGFLRSHKAGLPWYEAAQASAGNGAIMRIAPMLVPHLRTGGRALWADTAIAAMLTHNHAASISACLVLVAMLWDVLDMEAPPEPRWWRDRYVELAADLEGDHRIRARDGAFASYDGPLWRFVQERLAWAESENLSVLQACEAWHSGAYVLETVPCVLWTLMRHAQAPEEAIVRAVNDTWDNDTTAAIVGAFVGALHGAMRLPPGWRAGLSGRTANGDDGRIPELIGLARRRFVESAAMEGPTN